MTLHRLLLRRTSTLSSLIHHIQAPQTPIFIQFHPQTLTQTRTFAFSSAEEAAAERRRRKRRLRIEPPLHALRRDPSAPRPPPDPNAKPLPDTTSALTGPRLNLHNRVQSLIRAGDLDSASVLARQAVFSKVRPTVFTCNALVAAMFRAKRYDDAVSLFHYFFNQYNIVPNVVSYNFLINTHCDCGRVDVAIEVYKKILADAPFGPSSVTFRHLTKGLVDAGRIDEAVDMLREMLNKGLAADSLVYNNLIKGFLELGNFDRANEFFDELKERCLVYDGVVNATFMDWFFRQGRGKEAMESYRSLLDREFKLTPATCNVLLEVLLKYEKKKEAWELFDSMLDNHTPPNTQAVNSDTFNIMVNECFKEGKFEEAVSAFRKVGTGMKSRQFSMDVAGYTNIIVRFAELGMISEAEKFFYELQSKSLSADVTGYRTLIDAFLKEERVDDAVELFNKMVDANLRVIPVYANKWFTELILKEKAVECAQILAKMGEKDPKPDASSYEIVIKGLCGAGAFDLTVDTVGQAVYYGVGVTPSLREYLLELFAKEGRKEQLEKVLDERRQGWQPPRPQSSGQPGPGGLGQFPRSATPPGFQPSRTPSGFPDPVGRAGHSNPPGPTRYPASTGGTGYTSQAGQGGYSGPVGPTGYISPAQPTENSYPAGPSGFTGQAGQTTFLAPAGTAGYASPAEPLQYTTGYTGSVGSTGYSSQQSQQHIQVRDMQVHQQDIPRFHDQQNGHGMYNSGPAEPGKYQGMTGHVANPRSGYGEFQGPVGQMEPGPTAAGDQRVYPGSGYRYSR